MVEGERRWKIPCVCDSCDEYYRNILTDDEDMVDRFSIMARNRKTIGKHKEYDPNTKCVGDILVKTPIDTHKERKKGKKAGILAASDDPSDIDIKWTSENMIRTEGYNNTLSAFDKYYGDFPNMGMKSAIPNILLYGPPGTGKSIAVRSLVDKYPGFVYSLLTADDLSGDLKEIPGLIIDLWTGLSNEAQSKGTRGIFLIDELGSIGDSRKTSVKSTKKATETLTSLMDGLLCPGNVSVIAAANDTETIDPAIMDRFDEWVYYRKYSTEERINFLLVYTNIHTSVHDVPMESINIPELRDKLIEYTVGLDNGRIWRKLRRDYNWWYIKFKKPNIVTKDEFLSYLREFTTREDKKRIDMDTYNKVSIEKKGVGRPAKIIDGEAIPPTDAGFIYPSEEEMIDFLIENVLPKFKQDWINFKNKWEQKGCIGYQLEGHLKPSYKKAKEKIDKQKKTKEQHQTGFKEDGAKVDRDKKVEKNNEEVKVKEKVENKADLICDKCGHKFAYGGPHKYGTKEFDFLYHSDVDNHCNCTGIYVVKEKVENKADNEVCNICGKPSGRGKIRRSIIDKTWVHDMCYETMDVVHHRN